MLPRFLQIAPLILLLSVCFVSAHAADLGKLLTPEETAWIDKKQTIIVGVIDNEQPYSFYSRGRITGLSIDLLRMLEKKSGLHFKLVMGSWSNIYKAFQEGELDVVDQVSFTRERSDWMLFTVASGPA